MLVVSGCRQLSDGGPAPRLAQMLAAEGMAIRVSMLAGLYTSPYWLTSFWNCPSISSGGFSKYLETFRKDCSLEPWNPADTIDLSPLVGTPVGPTSPSEIVPGKLFLGNKRHASMLDTLRSLGVTHVLNVTEVAFSPVHVFSAFVFRSTKCCPSIFSLRKFPTISRTILFTKE